MAAKDLGRVTSGHQRLGGQRGAFLFCVSQGVGSLGLRNYVFCVRPVPRPTYWYPIRGCSGLPQGLPESLQTFLRFSLLRTPPSMLSGAPAPARVHPHGAYLSVPVHSGAVRNLKGEDRWHCEQCEIGEEHVFFAVVADGHGGARAAIASQASIVGYIVEAANHDASASSLRLAGTLAFGRMHSEVKAITQTAGTTLTVVMVNASRHELTTVHVGDSEAILVPHVDRAAPSKPPHRLCADHRLQDSHKECERVRALGGSIGRLQHPVTKEAAGPLRAFPGGVACARSIGDADVGSVISAVPATSTVPLKAHCAAGWDVVVASDGVWDALKASTVVRMCRHAQRSSASALAEVIVEQSVNSRHAFNNEGFKTPRDDTTCVVLRCFPPPGEAPSARAGCTLQCEVPSLVAEPVELDTSYVCDEPDVLALEANHHQVLDVTDVETPRSEVARTPSLAAVVAIGRPRSPSRSAWSESAA